MRFLKKINSIPFSIEKWKILGKDFFSKKDHFILHNRIILYIIFFISLADLFFLMNEEDWFSITVFFIIGFIISFFDKNMLVILFTALTFTNIVKYGTEIPKINENFSVCN